VVPAPSRARPRPETGSGGRDVTHWIVETVTPRVRRLDCRHLVDGGENAALRREASPPQETQTLRFSVTWKAPNVRRHPHVFCIFFPAPERLLSKRHVKITRGVLHPDGRWLQSSR